MKRYGQFGKLFAATSLCLSLVACDSGGSGDSSAKKSKGKESDEVHQTTGVLTGAFTNLIVSGLEYSTETLSGATNPKGEFHYKEGDRVNFRLGDIEFGGARASQQLDFFELIGGEAPKTIAQLENALNQTSINSLEMVVNGIWLLSNLDKDSDVSNGIDLSGLDLESLGLDHSSAQPVSLIDEADSESELPEFFSLAYKHTDFVNMSDVKALMLSRGVTAPMDLKFVMSSLYEALQLEISDERVSKVAISSGSEDVVNRELSFNEKGQLARELLLRGDTLELEIAYEYDNDGRLVSTQNLLNQQHEQVVYKNGKVERILFMNSDGSRSLEQIHEYNDDQLTRLGVDQDGDGINEQLIHLNYNADGRVSEFIVTGENQSKTSLTYEQDRLKERQEDLDSDGEVDLVSTYQYDQQGRLSTRTIESSAPQVESGISHFSYDGQGQKTRYTTDRSGDGVDDYIEVYRYNAFGDRSYIAVDKDGDGRWDKHTYYQYDLNGNRLSESEDIDGDGRQDYQWGAEIEHELVPADWSLALKDSQ